MTSVQTTIKFPITKKLTFYGTKDADGKQDFSNATIRNTPSSVRYVSKVKKIMTISSSESDNDSDSDTENSKRLTRKRVNVPSKNAAPQTPKSTRARRVRKASASDDKGNNYLKTIESDWKLIRNLDKKIYYFLIEI